MKGLILCGGLGTRLWPITLSLPKQLIPLAGRLILFNIIDSLIKADITEIGIVVGDNEETFRTVLESEYSNKNVELKYIKQNKPLGLANAVLISEDFIKEDDFIMILGDNFYELDLTMVAENYYLKGSNCHLLLKPVKEPKRYGIADVKNGRITDVIEKPDNPPSDLAITGIYIFDKNIFKACKNIAPSWRGEYEITDAIKWLINNGYVVTFDIINGIWRDLGKLEDVLDINRYKLSYIQRDIKGLIDNNSVVLGNVVIGTDSKIINSIIRGPVNIGRKTVIKNSTIGPYTSIYDEVNIENSNIENSIILDNCKIINIKSKLTSSIIERNCVIEGKNEDEKISQLLLGRSSKVIMGND